MIQHEHGFSNVRFGTIGVNGRHVVFLVVEAKDVEKGDVEMAISVKLAVAEKDLRKKNAIK